MTHLHRAQGRVIVVVADGIPPTDAEWGAFADDVSAAVGKQGAVRVLVAVCGAGGPSAEQRARVVEFRNADLRAAVLTDARLNRGFVTAVGWILGNRIRAFDPLSFDAATTFLGLDDDERAGARKAVDDLTRAGGLDPFVG